MTSRLASLTKLDSEKLVEDKDSQSAKRSTKVVKKLLASYKSNYAKFISSHFSDLFFFVQCIKKQLLTIIKFGSCDIPKNRG